MLYVRFLGGAGGVLLALMLLANAVLPTPEATPAGPNVEHPPIRITATTKGPERVVIDTSLPTVSTPATATAAAAPAPSSTAPVREAFAAIPADQPARTEPAAATPAPKDAGKDAKTQAHKSTHHRVAAPRAPYNYGQQPQPYFRQRPQFAGNFFGFWLR